MTTITFGGNEVKLDGKAVEVGQHIDSFNVVNSELKDVEPLKEYAGTKKLISVVPSLDTGVCQVQTKTFYNKAADVENTQLITISNDLPFAQKRFCADEGIENAVTFSDHKDLSFAKQFGTLMPHLRLQARSVFVLDEDDNVVYAEYVPEGTNEPDYDKAIDALKNI